MSISLTPRPTLQEKKKAQASSTSLRIGVYRGRLVAGAGPAGAGGVCVAGMRCERGLPVAGAEFVGRRAQSSHEEEEEEDDEEERRRRNCDGGRRRNKTNRYMCNQ